MGVIFCCSGLFPDKQSALDISNAALRFLRILFKDSGCKFVRLLLSALKAKFYGDVSNMTHIPYLCGPGLM